MVFFTYLEIGLRWGQGLTLPDRDPFSLFFTFSPLSLVGDLPLWFLVIIFQLLGLWYAKPYCQLSFWGLLYPWSRILLLSLTPTSRNSIAGAISGPLNLFDVRPFEQFAYYWKGQFLSHRGQFFYDRGPKQRQAEKVMTWLKEFSMTADSLSVFWIMKAKTKIIVEFHDCWFVECLLNHESQDQNPEVCGCWLLIWGHHSNDDVEVFQFFGQNLQKSGIYFT